MFFFLPESYAGRSVPGTSSCCLLNYPLRVQFICLLSVCVCVCASWVFQGALPPFKERSKKRVKNPKELMLRNIHMNTIFLCLGVSGGLCTCCFSWKSRPWFWSLNCSSSLTTRAKLKSRLTDFSWPCCFYQKPAGSRLRRAFCIHHTHCIT